MTILKTACKGNNGKSHFNKDLSVPFLSNYQDQRLVSNQTVMTTEIYLSMILSQIWSTKPMKQQ